MKYTYTFAAMLVASIMNIAESGTSVRERQRHQQQANRRTAITHINEYLPTHDVSDQFSLDLDLTDMEELVLSRQLNKAKKLYIEGGHSMSYARLTLEMLNGTAGALTAGQHVYGSNDDGDTVFGRLMHTVNWEDGDENVTIEVLYDRDYIKPHCQVGALRLVGRAQLSNCFTKSNSLKIGANHSVFKYSYDIHNENFNALSLQTIALNASVAFKGVPDFEIYTRYYGTPDYADRWAMAAASSGVTGFPSRYGNADFAKLDGRLGHGEGLLKGAAYLNVYMFVLGKMGLAVKYCNAGNFDMSEYSLDEAVAYYTGSLANKDTEDNGRFIYALADDRAETFKTSGHSGADVNGTAWVNLNVMKEFKIMQQLYKKKDPTLCTDADEASKLVGQIMKIPIIQSVLAYAYVREYDQDHTQDEVEKAEAKGATYAAAILPYMHECYPKHAEVLYENMRVGSDTKKLSYVSVKESLEACYDCWGITCTNIGGIWDVTNNDYSEGAGPCGVSSTSSSNASSKGGMSFGGIFGLTTAFVLCGFLFIRYRKRFSFFRRSHKELDMSSIGTIAAVSEIS